jgi:hypothetical protein
VVSSRRGDRAGCHYGGYPAIPRTRFVGTTRLSSGQYRLYLI